MHLGVSIKMVFQICFHPKHTLNAAAVEEKIVTFDHINIQSEHVQQRAFTCFWSRLLTPPPLQWACFQGDKHHVTQHCESCNNIVFIVGNGWNFFISRLEAERICRNAFPPGECRAENRAKYLLSFVLFSLTFLNRYCLSILLSISGHSVHLGCVWLAASHGSVTVCISYSDHVQPY